jgi:hypothetical protein
MNYAKDKRLARWLGDRGYDDRAKQVEALDGESQDYAKKLYQVIFQEEPDATTLSQMEDALEQKTLEEQVKASDQASVECDENTDGSHDVSEAQANSEAIEINVVRLVQKGKNVEKKVEDTVSTSPVRIPNVRKDGMSIADSCKNEPAHTESEERSVRHDIVENVGKVFAKMVEDANKLSH